MSEPWYAAGLKFTCTQCGNCCTGEPGNTWVSDAEVTKLAARLGLDEAAFRRKYTREAWRSGALRSSLIDTKSNDCVFYQRGVGCSVYEDRPRQCRTWPFWRANLRERDDWEHAGRSCPGIGKGQVRAAAEIAEIAGDDGIP
jgi:Fe-S-cluster containining protein